MREDLKGFWGEHTKESKRENRIKYTKANKEKISRKQLAFRLSKTLKDIHIVYCIPSTDIPYCGVTNQPYFRMQHHRNTYNRDTSEWFILQVCNTREEALKIESEYHKIGYSGAK